MDENRQGRSRIVNVVIIMVFLAIIISILAWITHGTIQGVLGVLAFSLVGLLNIFPWFLPIIGIPLGILDLLGIYGFNMYQVTLNLANATSSWMTITWYWIITILGIVIQIYVTYIIASLIRKKFVKKKVPKVNIALTNCTIIDGNRNSKIIENGVILIKNVVDEKQSPGLIVGVGKHNEIEIPKDYKIIDLQNQYVLPGLINSHCHLFGSGKPMKLMNLSDKMMAKLMKLFDSPLGRFYMKKRMKKNVTTALNAGLTTLRSMGDPSYMDLEIKKQIREGRFLGPRLLVSGLGLCPTGGHGGALGFVADDTGEIRKRIRKNIREEVDHIKILSTGGVMDARMVGEAGRPQMTIEEIETACFEAHRGGLLVATHCESTEGIIEALKGGIDSIEHGAEIPDDLVPLFKDNPKALRGYTTLTPTISAGMGLATLPIKDTKITQVKFENAQIVERGMIRALQKAYESGIKIACGTDSTVSYCTHYNVWKELKYYTHYTKMIPQEAIYFATKGSAEAIGIDDETGSIEAGKSADIQVVPDNPLENIDTLGKVSMVIIQGKVIKNPKVKKIKKVESVEIKPIDL